MRRATCTFLSDYDHLSVIYHTYHSWERCTFYWFPQAARIISWNLALHHVRDIILKLNEPSESPASRFSGSLFSGIRKQRYNSQHHEVSNATHKVYPVPLHSKLKWYPAHFSRTGSLSSWSAALFLFKIVQGFLIMTFSKALSSWAVSEVFFKIFCWIDWDLEFLSSPCSPRSYFRLNFHADYLGEGHLHP